MNNDKKQSDMIIVGKLGSSYGIRGWIKIFSYTEQSESIFAYKPWYLNIRGKWQEIELDDWKKHKNAFIGKLAGVSDRDDVQAYTNYEIGVSVKQFPELPQGRFYWKDLYGMRVETTAGYDLGTVSEIMETGSNDVLVVTANTKDAFNQKERLIPFLRPQVIKNIDVSANRIEVDWDPGF